MFNIFFVFTEATNSLFCCIMKLKYLMLYRTYVQQIKCLDINLYLPIPRLLGGTFSSCNKKVDLYTTHTHTIWSRYNILRRPTQKELGTDRHESLKHIFVLVTYPSGIFWGEKKDTSLSLSLGHLKGFPTTVFGCAAYPVCSLRS